MTLRPTLYLRELADLPHDLRWGRRHGALGAELRRRTVDQVYERGRYSVLEQDVTRAEEVPPPPGVSIRLVEGDDLAGLAPRRTLRALAHRPTHRCVVAWDGDRPVGYDCWSERLEPELDPFPLALPDGTAFGHDLFVSPAARGRGVGSALTAMRLNDVREHGYARLRRLIAPGNASSWQTARRSAPGEVVGDVWFVRTPGRVRTGFDPA